MLNLLQEKLTHVKLTVGQVSVVLSSAHIIILLFTLSSLENLIHLSLIDFLKYFIKKIKYLTLHHPYKFDKNYP